MEEVEHVRLAVAERERRRSRGGTEEHLLLVEPGERARLELGHGIRVECCSRRVAHELPDRAQVRRGLVQRPEALDELAALGCAEPLVEALCLELERRRRV